MARSDEASADAADRRRTFFVLALAGAVDAADAASLPALFMALQSSFGLGPQSLSMLSLGQGLAMALSGPLWGGLADQGSRTRVLAAGCLCWAATTAASAAAPGFTSLFLARTLTGAALSAVRPISVALTADLAPASQRGRVFGWLGLASMGGSILGGNFATRLGAATVDVGGARVAGWRAAMAIIAAASALLGAAVMRFASDPPRARGAPRAEPADSRRAWLEPIEVFRKTRTVHLIVGQGIVGGVPWSALAFLNMWLQYVGFSAAGSATVSACYGVGIGLGFLLGGYLGDAAAARSPDAGRTLVAQATTVAGIPLIVVLLAVLPSVGGAAAAADEGARARLFGGFLLCFALVMSWGGTAANQPIMAEVTPPHVRGSVYAWATSLEGASAAVFGAPLVALLSERVFGYAAPPAGTPVGAVDQALRAHNADALARSMLWLAIPPWVVCVWVWGLVRRSYPPERDAAAAAAAREYRQGS